MEMETWKHGDTWRHGDMYTWKMRRGDIETWRHGDICRDMKTLRQAYGDMETRTWK